MNMFKLRYSYGKVGNDVVGDNDQRFPYYLPSVPVGDLIMQTSDKNMNLQV